MIRFNCPRCRILIQLEEAPADGVVVCPECQKKLQLKARTPGPGVPPASAPPTTPSPPPPSELAVTDSLRITERPAPRTVRSNQNPMVLVVAGIGTAMVLGLVAIIAFLLLREEHKPVSQVATPPPSGAAGMSVPEGPFAVGPGTPSAGTPGKDAPSIGPTAPRRANQPPAKDMGEAEAAPPERKPLAPPKKASPEEIHQYALKSVVWIVNDLGETIATGTGTLIDKKHRLVVASQHVVHGNQGLFVVFPRYLGGKLQTDPALYQQALENKAALVQARVMVTLRAKDLALLELDRLPEGVEALPLAETPASSGDQVHAVANPAGQPLWMQMTGTVQQVARQQWRSRSRTGQVNEHAAEVIETELPTTSVDNGGPLLNERGELLGIALGATTFDGASSKFVSVAEVRTFVDDYFRQKGGRWIPDARAGLGKQTPE